MSRWAPTIRSRPPTWSRWRCCVLPGCRLPKSMRSRTPTRAASSRACASHFGPAAMAIHKTGEGGWVGRPIRRLEDPALVVGEGRFTADLPAACWVRFVRSPAPAARIVRIPAPAGATVITAADLAAVKPIKPMLHKFNYVPISQPVLAKDVVRFVGEPIAAVVASSREEAEDIADLVTMEIEETPADVDRGDGP